MNIDLLSNQGQIGGGEVMLLAIAEASRELGHSVRVIAPVAPSELADHAEAQGFEVIRITGNSTPSYLRNLRKWARQDVGSSLRWCNGLRPAFATSFLAERVVHLHQLPQRLGRLAAFVARRGAKATLVPSQFMASRIPGSAPLVNWTAEISRRHRPAQFDAPVVLGYLGRLSSDKGVPILCGAVQSLRAQGLNVQLLLAGESRFVSSKDAALVDDAVAKLGKAAQPAGWMNRTEFFDSVDLAVFPSVWEEPFGLVAAEAMAARCPLVVTDAGALAEVVGPNYPFIATANDVENLAKTITAAIAAEESWPETLDASFMRWQALYSPTAGKERLQQALTDVVRGTAAK